MKFSMIVDWPIGVDCSPNRQIIASMVWYSDGFCYSNPTPSSLSTQRHIATKLIDKNEIRRAFELT